MEIDPQPDQNSNEAIGWVDETLLEGDINGAPRRIDAADDRLPSTATSTSTTNTTVANNMSLPKSLSTKASIFLGITNTGGNKRPREISDDHHGVQKMKALPLVSYDPTTTLILPPLPFRCLQRHQSLPIVVRTWHRLLQVKRKNQVILMRIHYHCPTS